MIGGYGTPISDEVVHRGGVLLHNSCRIIAPEYLHNQSNISSGVSLCNDVTACTCLITEKHGCHKHDSVSVLLVDMLG